MLSAIATIHVIQNQVNRQNLTSIAPCKEKRARERPAPAVKLWPELQLLLKRRARGIGRAAGISADHTRLIGVEPALTGRAWIHRCGNHRVTR